MKILHRYVKRFYYCFKGYYYAGCCDHAFQSQLAIGGFLIIFAYFLWPLTDIELLALVGSYFLVLITELQNTAFEGALDRVHPELHVEIGRSKDIAAASVLTAGLLLFIIVFWILTNHLNFP